MKEREREMRSQLNDIKAHEMRRSASYLVNVVEK